MNNGPIEFNKCNAIVTLNDLLKRPIQNQLKIEKDQFIYCVANYLDSKSLISFSYTCRQAAEWTEIIRASSHLLKHVTEGNLDAVESILQMTPRLLCSKFGKIIDPTGKTIQGLTPYQAALCAGNSEMCEMIEPFFKILENGSEVFGQQYCMIFPQGEVAYRQEQKKVAFDFSKIIQAILNATDRDVTRAMCGQYLDACHLHTALKSFWAEFDELSYNELVFNPFHLEEALEQYEKLINAAVSTDKNILMWCQVVKYAQNHLPIKECESVDELTKVVFSMRGSLI